MKGASTIDKAAHLVFDFASNDNAVFRVTLIHCPHCNSLLQTYYCEERLYIIRCEGCGIVQLQKGKSGEDACKTAIRRLLKSKEVVYDRER